MPRRSKRTLIRRRRTKKRGRKRGQKGGILPLAAGGEAVGLGALSGAAGFGAKKALEAATRRRG